MAKTKLTAGAEVETLTRAELAAELRGWQTEAYRGIRPVHIQASGLANTTTGVIRIGGHVTITGGRLGPAAGFVWAVKRLAFRVDANPNIAWSLYINSVGPLNLVRDLTADHNGYCSWDGGGLLLNPDDKLVVSAAGGIGQSGYVSGQALEAPVGLLWRLLS